MSSGDTVSPTTATHPDCEAHRLSSVSANCSTGSRRRESSSGGISSGKTAGSVAKGDSRCCVPGWRVILQGTGSRS